MFWVVSRAQGDTFIGPRRTWILFYFACVVEDLGIDPAGGGRPPTLHRMRFHFQGRGAQACRPSFHGFARGWCSFFRADSSRFAGSFGSGTHFSNRHADQNLPTAMLLTSRIRCSMKDGLDSDTQILEGIARRVVSGDRDVLGKSDRSVSVEAQKCSDAKPKRGNKGA